jgi:hypothetical protein
MKWLNTTWTVIPANPGSRPGQAPGSKTTSSSWIPVLAGMTKRADFCGAVTPDREVKAFFYSIVLVNFQEKGKGKMIGSDKIFYI